jgi:hypothetical protein
MSVSFVSRNQAKNLKVPNSDNSIVSALKRGGHARRLRDEQRLKYQQYKKVTEEKGRFVGDLGIGDINGQESGITNLKICDKDGNFDADLNNEFVIGNKVFKANPKTGLIRLLDTDVIDDIIEQSIEEEEYLNGIISIMLTDKSGRVAKWCLGPDAYNSLPDDAKVEQLVNFHGASKEFSIGLHKLREKVRQNLPVLDQDKIKSYIERIKNSAHSKKAVDSSIRGTSETK